jgi:formylglycine-generating enzyme required for sulfatase activity
MRRAAALACLWALGCSDEAPARAQWTVLLATDAPVPQLGDRLLVEILGADGAPACEACRRVLAAGDPAAWPHSFGVVPAKAGAAPRVRARLYRADHVGFDGLPRGGAPIDALARLAPADEPVRVGLVLAVRCFGVAADPMAGTSCEPASGSAGPETTLARLDGAGEAALPRPGSWPGAALVPCAVEPPADMLCVPGGAFVMGSALASLSLGAEASVPERLVRLGPFALDRDEVTVGAVRALAGAGRLSHLPVPRGPDPQSLEGACTWLGVADAANDALPITCIDHPLAVEVCAALGKRLPTEAEWEWAAGNMTEESPYPWGYDDDVCAHAVVARGRFAGPLIEPTSCRAQGGELLPWGPVPGGSPADVSFLGLRNLGGSVREWVADWLAAYDGPCWMGGAPALVDPLCAAPQGVPERSLRGGGWESFAYSAHVYEREGLYSQSPGVGLRCASTAQR